MRGCPVRFFHESDLRLERWTEAYLPQIEVVTIPRMMHGEYVMMHPKEFAAQALAFFDGAETEAIGKENEGR